MDRELLLRNLSMDANKVLLDPDDVFMMQFTHRPCQTEGIGVSRESRWRVSENSTSVVSHGVVTTVSR